MNANQGLSSLDILWRCLPGRGVGADITGRLQRLMAGSRAVANLAIIHSACARMAAPFKAACGSPTVASSFALAIGEVLVLPPGRRLAVVSGQLWLTHAGDARDYLPGQGAVLVGGQLTVVEALSPALLQTL